jgi:haloalkane dehalogenase
VIPKSLKEEYPFAANTLKLKSGHNLNYVDEGEGPAIIMVHGNPTWSFYYRNLVKTLKSNYRVIVPDHIGCGLSDKPQDYTYRLEDHINNVNELIESLGLEKFSLVVHDWGGAIGFGVATQNPNAVEGIAALNTAAFRSKEIPKSINLCRIPFIGEKFVRMFNGFAYPATFMAVKTPLSKEVKRGFLLPYNNFRNRIATAKFVLDIPLSPNHESYETLKSVEEKLISLKCPIKLFWGEQDFCFTMNFHKRFKDFFPMAESKTYPYAGHYVLEDAKDEIMDDIKSFFQER